MSLRGLWQSQDERAKARELPAAIYGWFTEGFDTADGHDMVPYWLDSLTSRFISGSIGIPRGTGEAKCYADVVTIIDSSLGRRGQASRCSHGDSPPSYPR